MRVCSRIHGLIILMLALLLSAGCSLGGKEESQPIDPPQDIQVNLGGEQFLTSLNQISEEPKISISMYFKDPDGYVVPMKMSFPDTPSPAKVTLRYMVQNGPGEQMLPAGFIGLIPYGTEILGMDINEGLATVDFSEEFLNYQAEDERKILEAITWTLTEFPTIDQVQIRVNGKALKEMPVNGTPLDVPLSRSMGINLENENIVRPTATMPLTLYYQNQISGQDPYFVPITRLVERSEDKTQILLEELIKGPAVMTGLMPIIDDSVKVLNKSEKEGLVTVNFSEELAGENQIVSAEAVQSIVLTLTENLPTDTQVQILVDGSSSFKDSSSQIVEQPVTRPLYVNDNPL